MVPMQEILYIITIAILCGVAYRIDMRIAAFFGWLEEITLIGGEIINRLDRLASQLYDLSRSFHKDYDFVSNKLFQEIIKNVKSEICSQVLKDFKTKNGLLKKKIVDEFIKLAAERAVKHKSKD